ncbi:hypothetical protein NT6N_16010 [Oceaniferula spumae]|uniref:Uncharacterized protein n=1 Tax=Oceaniferula spumae TaxID=2979115 RepID=A0AAT9FKQ0_9BACT
MKHFLFLLPLFVVPLLAQTEEDKEKAALASEIRVIIAGIRPAPVFEKQGGEYVEVEPPLKSIYPTEISLLAGEIVKPKGAENKKNDLSIWPNQILNVKPYKGPAAMKLGLLRRYRADRIEQSVEFDIGEMITPLAIIHADPGTAGWEKPQVKLVELSPEKAPTGSVIMVNLSGVPLAARFESVADTIKPGAVKFLKLPARETDVFRFRIDVPLANGKTYPLANSSYRIRKNQRLILLAIHDPQAPKGSPPLKLQMILDS